MREPCAARELKTKGIGCVRPERESTRSDVRSGILLELMKRFPLMTVFAALAALSACGPGVDRESTLARLRTAMEEEVVDQDVLAEHNRLVLLVRDAGVLNEMRRAEVQTHLGRGQECGSRELCVRQGFKPTDWVYEVGRRDGLPWGPTLIIGFDRQGFVDGVYTLTREGAQGPTR